MSETSIATLNKVNYNPIVHLEPPIASRFTLGGIHLPHPNHRVWCGLTTSMIHTKPQLEMDNGILELQPGATWHFILFL